MKSRSLFGFSFASLPKKNPNNLVINTNENVILKIDGKQFYNLSSAICFVSAALTLFIMVGVACTSVVTPKKKKKTKTKRDCTELYGSGRLYCVHQNKYSTVRVHHFPSLSRLSLERNATTAYKIQRSPLSFPSYVHDFNFAQRENLLNGIGKPAGGSNLMMCCIENTMDRSTFQRTCC